MIRNLYHPKAEVYEPIEIREDELGTRISYNNQPFTVDLMEILPGQFSALVNGRSVEFSAARLNADTIKITTASGSYEIKILSKRQKLAAELFGSGSSDAGEGELQAPMPGLILRIEVAEGDVVSQGQPLLIMEAMKMENEIKSPIDGVITKILITEQTAVEKDDLLLVIADA